MAEVQDVLEKEHSNVMLINVLPHAAFEEAHIPASINIPIDRPDFMQQVEKHALTRNTPIIVYCASPGCQASKSAVIALEKEGYTNVMHFEGGMEAWKNAGKDVQTGS